MANTGGRKPPTKISPMGLPEKWFEATLPFLFITVPPSTPSSSASEGWVVKTQSDQGLESPGNRAERVHVSTMKERCKGYIAQHGYIWEMYSDGSNSFPLTLLRTTADSCWHFHWHFHFCCILRLPCLFMFRTQPVPVLPVTHSL